MNERHPLTRQCFLEINKLELDSSTLVYWFFFLQMVTIIQFLISLGGCFQQIKNWHANFIVKIKPTGSEENQYNRQASSSDLSKLTGIGSEDCHTFLGSCRWPLSKARPPGFSHPPTQAQQHAPLRDTLAGPRPCSRTPPHYSGDLSHGLASDTAGKCHHHLSVKTREKTE